MILLLGDINGDCSSEGRGVESRQSPVLDSKHWECILQEVVKSPLLSAMNYYPEMKTKDASCNISAILTMEAARYFESHQIKCSVERTDKDPDLNFTNLNIKAEIKVTRLRGKKFKWMGGSFSKRSGLHFLVGWKKESTLDGEGYFFFIVSGYLDETECVSLGNNYYATAITVDSLSEKNYIIGNPTNPRFYSLS